MGFLSATLLSFFTAHLLAFQSTRDMLNKPYRTLKNTQFWYFNLKLTENYPMKMLYKLSLAGLFALNMGNALASESLVDKAIEYRKGAFAVMAWNFGTLAAMVKGEQAFDAQAFAEKAGRVALIANLPIVEGFEVEGSDKGKTEAKPEIWKDFDKFKSGLGKLQEEADKLAEVAKTAKTVDEVKDQFAATGKVCKGCHEEFKED